MQQFTCFLPGTAPANASAYGDGVPFPAPLCFHGLCAVDPADPSNQWCECDAGWESDRFMFHNDNCERRRAASGWPSLERITDA